MQVLARVAMAALVVMLACGEATDRSSPNDKSTVLPPSTTTTVDLGTAYAEEITSLLASTEQLIERSEPSSANQGGFLTVASAYSGLADLLEKAQPPPSFRVNHQALVGFARLVAEEAASVADIPAISIRPNGLPETGGRLGPSFALEQHRAEFRSLVAEVAQKARVDAGP